MDAASSVSLSSLLVRVALKSHDLRLASLPAIVSTSGRSHGELLRLLYLLADKNATRFFQALGEEVDVGLVTKLLKCCNKSD